VPDCKPYDRDPNSARSARRPRPYLKASALGDTASSAPKPNSALRDVRWGATCPAASSRSTPTKRPWNTRQVLRRRQLGHRPTVKGGYFPGRRRRAQDIPRRISLGSNSLRHSGRRVPNHEVCGAGRTRWPKFSTLGERADWTQKLKYVILNGRLPRYDDGKTATHLHASSRSSATPARQARAQSVWKDRRTNLLSSCDGLRASPDFAL